MKFLQEILNSFTITSETGISEKLGNYLDVYTSIQKVNIISFKVLKYFHNPITKSENIVLEINGKGNIKILIKRARSFSIYENGKTICLNRDIDW